MDHIYYYGLVLPQKIGNFFNVFKKIPKKTGNFFYFRKKLPKKNGNFFIKQIITYKKTNVKSKKNIF